MPIPVILDTDIGHDVDDVWALVFMLRCPELDVRLITTCTGDTTHRAALVAKILELMDCTHIPIGIGIPLDDNPHTHEHWLGDYDLAQYSGTVINDGVGAICDTVMAAERQLSLICIGPLPNIAAALAREPDICSKAKFVGMHGSIRRGYLGSPKPMREFNVKVHALACRAVFAAPWKKVITPLDTCGDIVLDGERFAAIQQAAATLGPDSPADICLANHRIWSDAVSDWPIMQNIDAQIQSSILYDLVAIYLGFDDALLDMETLPIVVTADGKTVVDEAGAAVDCAMNWQNKDAFLDLVTARLIGAPT